ncbi:MAG TPA: hypothetical protein VF177_04395 [Anaerolineae bacterium]
MRLLRLLNLFLAIAVLASITAPVAFAATAPDSSTGLSSQVAFQEEPETEQPVENAAAGAAAGMLIVGFILFLVFIIAILGAVGLGVVGLGLQSVQAEE